MLRSEVIAGIQSLRRFVEQKADWDDVGYYDDILCEARDAILLNEQNDPHAP
jgi:hypothetical protein